MSLLKKARVAALIAAGDEFFSGGQLAEALARFKFEDFFGIRRVR